MPAHTHTHAYILVYIVRSPKHSFYLFVIFWEHILTLFLFHTQILENFTFCRVFNSLELCSRIATGRTSWDTFLSRPFVWKFLISRWRINPSLEKVPIGRDSCPILTTFSPFSVYISCALSFVLCSPIFQYHFTVPFIQFVQNRNASKFCWFTRSNYRNRISYKGSMISCLLLFCSP